MQGDHDVPLLLAGTDFHLRGAACYRLFRAPLAQLVEQLTLNQRVRGSKP